MSNEVVIFEIGVSQKIKESLIDLTNQAKLMSVAPDVEAISNGQAEKPTLILVGETGEIPPIEIAQLLRMEYQQAAIFLVTFASAGFERRLLMKNGFSDAFLLPMDLQNLRQELNDQLAQSTQGKVKAYRAVKMIDLGPGEVMDFDTSIYMPANKRYVKVSNAGESLTPEMASKMKQKNFNSLHIPSEQVQKFYDYTAARLRNMGDDSTMSSTEKSERLRSSVRSLISGLFTSEAISFESGQSTLKDCSEIVKSFILQGPDMKWYAKIQEAMGADGNAYSHSANVSTFAALFSLALGIGKPEEMALAGLLHDLGISLLPVELQAMDEADMSAEQKKIYQRHPELSVDIIKSRKIVVSEIVMKAILQHHERFSGLGFPKGWGQDRICKEAQILALADVFDELTRLRPGHLILSPLEALQSLINDQAGNPASAPFDPAMLKQLSQLFEGEATSDKATA